VVAMDRLRRPAYFALAIAVGPLLAFGAVWLASRAGLLDTSWPEVMGVLAVAFAVAVGLAMHMRRAEVLVGVIGAVGVSVMIFAYILADFLAHDS